MSEAQKVLVTGASGFIGGRVVEAMFLTGLARPRAMLRRWSGAARIARFPIEIVIADLMEPDQIERTMEGVTAVVHAGYTDEREVIVEGTRHMLDAALRHGVRRFVHMSTAEVYGRPTGRVEETQPYGYTGEVYGDSKIEAERLCWDYLQRGLPVTVLRPSIVYGPFSKVWTVGFADRLQSGAWATFRGYADGLCNLVYVDDLVGAILLALEHPQAVGQAFNVNGANSITWNEYFRRFNAALGLPDLPDVDAGRARLRTQVMGAAGALTRYLKSHAAELAQPVYRRLGGASRSRLRGILQHAKRSIQAAPSQRELLNLYSRDAWYDPDKAGRLLGYVPRFGLDEGLRLSVLWLQHHELVPSGMRRRSS